jgi:hypothetical protein
LFASIAIWSIVMLFQHVLCQILPVANHMAI